MADTDSTTKTAPDLGDLMILLLAGTLVGLRDRLWDDGFHSAVHVVADLVSRCDAYIAELIQKGDEMRYVVSVDVLVEATSEDEASMFVERALAGRHDCDINEVFEEGPGPGQISWDAGDPRREL